MDYYDDCEYEESPEISDDELSENSSAPSSEDEDSNAEESECEEDIALQDFQDEDADDENEQETEESYIGFNFMTKFEKTRLLGIRTEQIIAGAKIFIETDEKDPFEIAKMELYQRRMPLKIRRYFGKKYVDIDVNDKKFIIV